jgi:hypothetical protein
MKTKRIVLMMIFAALALPDLAAAASRIADQEVAVFEQGAGQCQSLPGDAERIRCVAEALQRLASGLQRGNVSEIAPQAAPAMRKAAADVAAARTRPAALSALNRAQAVVRGLAAKSSGEATAVYGSLMRALSRAQAAIGGRG